MSVTAELSERGDVVILSEYRDKDLVKQIPGTRWDRDERCWRAHRAWTTCKTLRGVFGERLRIGERLATWAWDHRTNVIDEGVRLRLAVDDEEMGRFEPRLWPFQRGGAAFLARMRAALLCDEMGSGKTVQMITAVRFNNAHPILVICPRTVKEHWVREFHTWWPDLRVTTLGGGAAERKRTIDEMRAGDHDVLIVHWEVVRNHSRLAPYGDIALSDEEKRTKDLNLVPWKCVIADEAHRMKNPRAKQTRAVWHLMGQRSVEMSVGMTGTPIGNAPDDLWSLLHGVLPHEFPSKTRYVDRYCLQSWNPFGGLDIIGIRPDVADEFHEVVDPHMRRMPKAVVLTQLPPRIGGTQDPNGPQLRVVEMSTKQRKAYEDMALRMVAGVGDDEDDVVIAPNPIAQLTRMLQFASAYAEIVDGQVRLTEPSCKVDALLELLEDVNGESLVVFHPSRQLINLCATRLAKEGVPHGLIVGGQTEGERQRNIDLFQDGKLPVILATIAAGGTGITLTQARITAFLGRSYSFIDNEQAEGRTHRIGSEHHESILYLDYVAANTCEPEVLDALITKKERLEEIVRDAHLVQRLLTTGISPAKLRKVKR